LGVEKVVQEGTSDQPSVRALHGESSTGLASATARQACDK